MGEGDAMRRALATNLVGALLVAGLGVACRTGGAAPAGNRASTTAGAPPSAQSPSGQASPNGALDANTSGASSEALAPAPAAEAAPPALRSLELPIASTNATMTPFWVAVEQGLWRQ